MQQVYVRLTRKHPYTGLGGADYSKLVLARISTVSGDRRYHVLGSELIRIGANPNFFYCNHPYTFRECGANLIGKVPVRGA